LKGKFELLQRKKHLKNNKKQAFLLRLNIFSMNKRILEDKSLKMKHDSKKRATMFYEIWFQRKNCNLSGTLLGQKKLTNLSRLSCIFMS
jgi:hypothetical protein